MITITDTAALADFCTRARAHPYVTVDTEFLRERTYYSRLCLIQMAVPGDAEEDAVLVDPLAEGLSLDPLYELYQDESVVKVFHAARQDVEIFVHDRGIVPTPLFDTQVAAMVCGFGEQVGYETLVRKIARAQIDKSSRFTDWSRRPLTDAQKTYALADVTHLRDVYEYLAAELKKSGRTEWVEEEVQVLTDPATYIVTPEEAWRRVKTRTQSGKFMAIVRELAAFRESYAQEHNVPRTRVYKDDALVELASTKPQSEKDLGRSRLLLREARKGEIADGILAAIQHGMAVDPKNYPASKDPRDQLQVNPALADLLRVLLKAKADTAGVAQKLIATSSELDQIAAGETDVAALTGWRKTVFGADALRLMAGEVGLRADGRDVVVFDI
ncbi:Ribonuclease D [Rhodobacteraceae bacterium THAF1]|uniref:ribonuclease D n=1 Tax=Palleronia sp. THAF1 TaxID=2587842 RepID=UPI000F3C1BC1|nr:ribonuclease D [Palleronia sp. THAF1]QFU08183.1 Ribonuclease D [Palleronia sp. THAF1]VDC28735.1 Ribonuclease D [Rhodobacteraceae bacterium THAF1]